MNRRTFLTRSGLALGALIVGDEALDAFARLTHVRKSFPSAGVPTAWRYARFRFEVPSPGAFCEVIFEGSTDGKHFTPLGAAAPYRLGSTYTVEINGRWFAGAVVREIPRTPPLDFLPV